ncbi:long-chain fatty acid--CoA ligase [Luteitalea pratensis]|nr:long-chain fatty acid--CoA ligase [Luteitalea pratensis]
MRGLMMGMPLSIPALLRRAESIFPHKAIIGRLPDRSVSHSTYRECLVGARRLAAAMRSLGVRQGDRVATFCWNHERHLHAYYGIPASGAILHTLNIRLHPDELAYIINHADDSVVIVDKVLWPLFEPVRQRIGDRRIVVISDDADVPPGTQRYDDLLAAQDAVDGFDDVDEQSAAVMCYTSGTTGRSKGVLYSHRSLVLHSLAAALPDMMNLAESSRVLGVVPMFHANAWGLPFACALVGAAQVLPGPYLDAASIVALLETERVTHALGVPTIAHALLQHLDAHPGHDLSALRILLVGGAAIPEATIRAFDGRHGIRVVHAWGMTETAPLGSINRLPSELADAPGDAQFAWRAKQGRPAPFVEVRARADDGSLVPCDDVAMGELEVRGPWVAAAYYPGDEAKDRWTDDGWFRTGDIVTIGATGCLTICDRAKDLVKSGGEWISSVTLEGALIEHPGIAEVVVIAVPHERWGERPLAVVVPVPGCQPTLHDVRAHLDRRVARWWLPDGVVLVDSLPRTGVGKYQKNVLRERYKGYFESIAQERAKT